MTPRQPYASPSFDELVFSSLPSWPSFSKIIYMKFYGITQHISANTYIDTNRRNKEIGAITKSGNVFSLQPGKWLLTLQAKM